MNNRESPLYWSFPCGTWFQTRIRISIWFPLILVVLWFHLGVQLGTIFGVILFLSVLAHEYGHVTAARLTGGSGDEILIWPLGGLAFVQPAATFQSQLLSTAAGPLVNLILCAVTLPAVLQFGAIGDVLNPLVFPMAELSGQLVRDVLVLTFFANWIQLLVNLIPVFPLDGGRMLQTCLAVRFGGETTTTVYLRIGFIVGLVGMFAGLILASAWVVCIAAVVLILNLHESVQLRMAESYDESFMGYDFSQGYTSLERSHEPSSEQRPGFLQRWREKRQAEKQRREAEQAAEIERQLDLLLEKVHTAGIESLTESERRLLDSASARYRDKDKGGR